MHSADRSWKCPHNTVVGQARRWPQAALSQPPPGRSALWLRRDLGALRAGRRAPIEFCAVITTATNELLRPIPGRMPAILQPEDDRFDLRVAMATQSRRM